MQNKWFIKVDKIIFYKFDCSKSKFKLRQPSSESFSLLLWRSEFQAHTSIGSNRSPTIIWNTTNQPMPIMAVWQRSCQRWRANWRWSQIIDQTKISNASVSSFPGTKELHQHRPQTVFEHKFACAHRQTTNVNMHHQRPRERRFRRGPALHKDTPWPSSV